jgi:NlpC/P60 family
MQFFTALLLAVTLLFFEACKPPGKVNANVVPFKDSVKLSLPAATVIDTVKEYDSLQIEFGKKLGVSYDSIYNLKLYRFIKENLDKKCSGSQREDYTCESFLPAIFKNVYSFDLPATIAGQMQYKGLELYSDTSYLHEGDVVFFCYSAKQKDKISHNGFYLWNGYFLIATFSKGIIITELSKSFWATRFVAAGRIKKQAFE